MKKYVITAVIGIVLYLVLGTVLPFIPHKEVSEEYMENAAGRIYTSDSTQTERIAYLKDNVEAMKYRVQMAKEAEEEIILSTFDFNADEAGRSLMSVLLEAAGRGVKVKVIIDGLSGFLDTRGNDSG